METIIEGLVKNNLIVAFLTVGVILFLSYWLSKTFTKGKIPGAAIAISAGLIIAYFGGDKGISNIPLFSGMAILGGNMLRDFSIVSTAMGASISQIKKAGWIGFFSLLIGIGAAFFSGALLAYVMGYHDIKSVVTIGAGACTFIVSPVTANPKTAMIYGGVIGTTSGVAAGLAATDPKLVPYGALTATFYTGLACLLCPSVLYYLIDLMI